ncbi:sugar phosphate isomerase/epimerase [Thermodesulfobacterium sp. TA1]|uniref:sugar phosphate isomerase/epimerase family protein n=1 Tax=Thermodesulfobacterium sp. TA1 TaxID=2234087 RepID=UPI001231B3AB|nr:sugar phosphate isomerase/epimerase family protein [Thermodesulfobacterium sp. TA1]QER42028.1 sugar phosphate isomerase/epimerase [Thermodesulfobacterium sp. TA1]
MNPLVFVSIPFNLLKEKYLPLVLAHRINVEVSLNAFSLDNYPYSTFKEIAVQLKNQGLLTTVHLPFIDLSIGSVDLWIREVSFKRIFLAVERASLFQPLNLVLHSGYSYNYHEIKEEWREQFIENLNKLLDFIREENLFLSLENVYEPTPEFMLPIFEAFYGKIGWCFDPAHGRVFSKKDELQWLQTLYPYLKEIHCHDNLGEEDDHLAVGKGVLKFEAVFHFLKEKKIVPILTSEAHNEEDTYVNLEVLTKTWKKLREVTA